MDTLTHYRNTIQKTIEGYYDRSQADNNDYLIFDRERDRYLWLRSG